MDHKTHYGESSKTRNGVYQEIYKTKTHAYGGSSKTRNGGYQESNKTKTHININPKTDHKTRNGRSHKTGEPDNHPYGTYGGLSKTRNGEYQDSFKTKTHIIIDPKTDHKTRNGRSYKTGEPDNCYNTKVRDNTHITKNCKTRNGEPKNRQKTNGDKPQGQITPNIPTRIKPKRL